MYINYSIDPITRKLTKDTIGAILVQYDKNVDGILFNINGNFNELDMISVTPSVLYTIPENGDAIYKKSLTDVSEYTTTLIEEYSGSNDSSVDSAVQMIEVKSVSRYIYKWDFNEFVTANPGKIFFALCLTASDDNKSYDWNTLTESEFIYPTLSHNAEEVTA